jgi:VIT1/CCC1 family predicted Fe2+/Mn2+ transporter
MTAPYALQLALAALLGLVPLDTAPQGRNGFAGSIVLAFVALGLLIILAKWTSSKPKKPKK